MYIFLSYENGFFDAALHNIVLDAPITEQEDHFRKQNYGKNLHKSKSTKNIIALSFSASKIVL